MSDGKILHGAPYTELLASSEEFRDLVHVHEDTIDQHRLGSVDSQKRCKTSIVEITSISDNKHKEMSMQPSGREQLIKKEEREIADTSMKPYVLYLSQNKGYLYASSNSFACNILGSSNFSEFMDGC